MLTKIEKLAVAEEIESVVRDFLNPETLNYESYISLRANVDGFLNAGDGQIAFTDYQSFKEGMKTIFESFKRFTEMKITQCFVFVLAEDAASCTVEFKGKYLATNDQEANHNGCWTFVFCIIDGEWKVVHENGTHTQ